MAPALPRQNRRFSLITSILAWCSDRAKGVALLARERPRPVQTSNVAADAGPCGAAPDLPRHSYDASLLFRRMAALQIDRDELASNDPLLFRELQGLCALCRNKERCVLELAQASEGGGHQSWREYCPNDTTLTALAALQNCPRAAQYLRKPRSTGYLDNE